MIPGNFKKYAVALISITVLMTATLNAWADLPCTPQCGSSHDTEKVDHHPETSHNDAVSTDTADQKQTVCYKCMGFYGAILTVMMSVADTEADRMFFTSSINQFILVSYNHLPDPYKPLPA